MPLYQITTIVRATSSTAEVRSLLMRITQLVLDGKGVLAGVSHWGLQPLAYRMECHQEFHRDGRFLQMKFIMSPQTLAEVDRSMRIDEWVLGGGCISMTVSLASCFRIDGGLVYTTVYTWPNG